MLEGEVAMAVYRIVSLFLAVALYLLPPPGAATADSTMVSTHMNGAIATQHFAN